MSFEIPYKLKEAVQNNKLLVFVGAGVSKIAGLPLWKEIVINLLNNPSIKKREALLQALEAEILTPLEVLDKLEITNKIDVYNCFEKETSKTLKHNIYDKITDISKKIITTNYDNLIEHNTGIKELDTSSAFNLKRIDELDQFVLKIHGSNSAIDNTVIFTSDYEKLYGGGNELAKFQLEKLVTSYSCLFIGFSMTDNYVTSLFDRLNEMYRGLGNEHFIISTQNVNHDFLETIYINSHDQLILLLEEISIFKSDLEIEESLANKIIDQQNLANSTIIENPLPEEGIKINSGHDTPPKIEYWAGRGEEIKSIISPHKVCFITGIGGQGKSALASKVLSSVERNEYVFQDWRDFKEEDLNLQSKLFQLIEIVSEGEIKAKQIIGWETIDLINLFFDKLGEKKGIFVFDNIDKYIDLQKFMPSGEMNVFFYKALKSQHNSKFIFTCRPFIHFAGVGFYQVKLEGLEIQDTKDLIIKYHNTIPSVELQNLANRLHLATGGHPLWMVLILAQSRNNIRQIDSILKKIETENSAEVVGNISSLISETILKNAWAGLKDREKIILRTLSISSISESEQDLAKIVSKKLNHNQFIKGLKSLRSLNLIISKEGIEHVELHPLVREFIKVNYGREEQESYIALYVSYLDGFIILLKNKLGSVLGQDDIDKIIKKIEVLITTDKIQDSINELRLTEGSFQISGFSEEFLRLVDILLSKNIWTLHKLSAINGFFEFINCAFTRMVEFGCYEMFDKYIDKYLSIFSNADSNMILAKSAICHREWISGNFSVAIREGRSASDLIDILGENDKWSGKHRFNLALRDSKISENIEKALIYFCESDSLENLINEKCVPEKSAIYGNVGRCLAYLNRINEALFLTSKSYTSLKEGKNNSINKHNLGYASKWIGEILLQKEEFQESLAFYINARNIWKNDMPIEANLIDLSISQMSKTVSEQSIINLESWQITKYCNDWIDRYYQKCLERSSSISTDWKAF